MHGKTNISRRHSVFVASKRRWSFGMVNVTGLLEEEKGGGILKCLRSETM